MIADALGLGCLAYNLDKDALRAAFQQDFAADR